MTHINDYIVGQGPRQIVPTLITWKKLPGDKIILTYKKQSEKYKKNHKARAKLACFPDSVDFRNSSVASLYKYNNKFYNSKLHLTFDVCLV